MKSIKSNDRELAVWYNKIDSGEIKLPRFQRFEAWDKKRIAGLLSVVVNNLPLGITLILEVNKPQFIDKYIQTAPKGGRVFEHLLDGQQRLTAFWRMMHNNYEWDTYYVYIPELAKSITKKGDNEIIGYCQGRWMKNGFKYPLWADKPAEVLHEGLIPSNLLRPGDSTIEISNWIEAALQKDKPLPTAIDYGVRLESYYKRVGELRDKIVQLREIVAHYNIPYLALPSNTPKEVALNVFINMNTNSKPLSMYDIIVAEIENAKEQSLHDMESNLKAKYPNIKYYGDISDLILSTSALLQDQLPNQRGFVAMNKAEMVDRWGEVERGIEKLILFLGSQGIFDIQRLPTSAVLAVLAALYAVVPETGDRRGFAETIFKKYLWRSFFTERYDNSTNSRAFQDYKYLKLMLNHAQREDGEIYELSDVPIFSTEYPLASVEKLKTVRWPKGENIYGRAILAVANYLGAMDFADGIKLTRENLANREYHHIFPHALLQEAGLFSSLSLNCALITDKTNRNIGRKEPLQYLKEKYEWVDRAIIDQRLQSHLIPVDQLATGGYEGLEENQMRVKIRTDFEKFLIMRAILIHKAAVDLSNGLSVNYSDISSFVEKEVSDEFIFNEKNYQTVKDLHDESDEIAIRLESDSNFEINE